MKTDLLKNVHEMIFYNRRMMKLSFIRLRPVKGLNPPGPALSVFIFNERLRTFGPFRIADGKLAAGGHDPVNFLENMSMPPVRNMLDDVIEKHFLVPVGRKRGQIKSVCFYVGARIKLVCVHPFRDYYVPAAEIQFFALQSRYAHWPSSLKIQRSRDRECLCPLRRAPPGPSYRPQWKGFRSPAPP